VRREEELEFATIDGGMTATGAGTAPEPRLVRAAHEFEGQMMKELLKPLTRDSATGEDTDDGADEGSAGALGEFASEALGQALSARGGFGIADQIVKELSGRGNNAQGQK
jgi:Rod binding domain-containing protein